MSRSGPRRNARRNQGQGLQGHGPIDATKVVERAALALVTEPNDEIAVEENLEELEALAQSAGVEVVAALTQQRSRRDTATYFGSGKLDEFKELCHDKDVAVAIFGHDLTPAQGRNVEEALGIRVVDRSQLIMDLFASRARSYEARLQVELAQLQYSLPRLRRMWTHLDRYKGGVGMRGPGETQLESDRREIGRKIADRRRKLERRERHQDLTRGGRTGRFSVGLIGYTCAGKSTLFNRLTGSDVLEESRPFSTLDTRTKLWRAGRGCEVLLSDTIGFIRDLPHHLIASFQATLAEAVESDLLLHVVDASRPDAPALKAAVEEVLGQIGADERPRLVVANKVDAVVDRALLAAIADDLVPISAKSGEGLDDLAAAVVAARRAGFREMRLGLPPGRGDLLALLQAEAEVLEIESRNGRVEVRARVGPGLAGRLSSWTLPPAQPSAGTQ